MVAKRQLAGNAQLDPTKMDAALRKQAVITLVRVADRLRRRFAAVLEPAGLTSQQFNVLRILRGALPDSLPTMEIAERMIEQTPAITGLLDRLESKQLIARARLADDRRCVRCSITTRGLELLTELDDPTARADVEALEMLNDEEVQRLNGLLGLVLHD